MPVGEEKFASLFIATRAVECFMKNNSLLM